MRPAQTDDLPQLSALVTARRGWLGTRKSPIAVPDPAFLAPSPADPVGTHWVCQDEAGGVRGITTLAIEVPDGTWQGSELEEPALLLTGTWTDPMTRSDKLGALIAWWALGHAAGHETAAVRRIAPSAALSAHHQRQGWTLQRTAHTPAGTERHLLTRRAKPVPGLELLISDVVAVSTALA